MACVASQDEGAKRPPELKAFANAFWQLHDFLRGTGKTVALAGAGGAEVAALPLDRRWQAARIRASGRSGVDTSPALEYACATAVAPATVGPAA
jgi:hypothetical protein